MARPLNDLSAVEVKNALVGKHSDGGGQRVLRITVQERRREMGLASSTNVSLKEARDAAEKWRAVTRSNVDPIKEHERHKREVAKKLRLLKEILPRMLSKAAKPS